MSSRENEKIGGIEMQKLEKKKALEILGYELEGWSDDDILMSSPTELVESYSYPPDLSWYNFINDHYNFHELAENSYYLEAPLDVFPNFLLIIEEVPYDMEIDTECILPDTAVIVREKGTEVIWKVTEVRDKDEAVRLLNKMEEMEEDEPVFKVIFRQTHSCRRYEEWI